MGVLRHVSYVGEDLAELIVSKVCFMGFGLLEGCEVSKGVCLESSRAAVVLLRTHPCLPAIQCGFPTL